MINKKEYHKQYNKTYIQSEKHKRKHRYNNLKYSQSPKGKATHKQYLQSQKGKKLIQKYNQKNKKRKQLYMQKYQKEHIDDMSNHRKKYSKTKKGKMAAIRGTTKHRQLGFVKLFPNPFDKSEPIDWHHIDNENVVAIPRNLHRLYLGKQHREMTITIVKQIYLGGE